MAQKCHRTDAPEIRRSRKRRPRSERIVDHSDLGSMRIVPGTGCAALRYETKSPRPGLHNRSRGLLLVQQGCRLPAGLEAGSAADLEAGSATRAAPRAAAKDVTAGDKLDPKRTVAFVVRGGAGLSADRYTGLQIRWTNNRQRRLGHDQFDPERIPAPEIRRRVRLAQCVHAGLFRSGGCFGETRQLKYH